MADPGLAETRVRTEDGQVYVPATQRADGSWRKPRRVRDGYVPQDEVGAYKSRGAAQAQARQVQVGGAGLRYPVGLAPSPEAEDKPAPKKAGRKRAKKPAGAKPSEPAFVIEEDIPDVSKMPELGHVSDNDSPPHASEEEAAKLEKRLRAVRKKLQDVEKLQKRIDAGELERPEKTQLEKLAKRPALQHELDELERQMGRLAAS